jgi:hypothetical protein
MVDWIKNQTGGFGGGLAALAILMALNILLILGVATQCGATTRCASARQRRSRHT